MHQHISSIENQSQTTKAALKLPDFPRDHTWFNCEPLSLPKHLKGKLVLIDFWTYCCINCLHVLTDMEYLEEKFSKEASVAFIGCHSAKFLNERGDDKVRDAVLRYEIKHPVINDDKMLVWRGYERRSWPSFVIVSPKSQIPIFFCQGEGHRSVLDLFLSTAFDHYYDQLNHNKTFAVTPEESKS